MQIINFWLRNPLESYFDHNNVDCVIQADWIIPSHRPPDEWPHQGRIEIERFNLRYREQLPPALKDINCAIGAKEKVSVV